MRDPLLAAGYTLYPLALSAPRRRWEPRAALGVISVLAVTLATVGGPAPQDSGTWAVWMAFLGCALLGGVWTVGRAVGDRRAHVRYTTQLLADRAVADERLRIARELHDVVSHTLSVIGVKAAIAHHVADVRPDEARDALGVIERTSRDALT
ncbi:MAG: histidine kinase dimerization/phosphoacceptor domain-containing protein, partial [Micromonosporaceae bacterium]|nr:histidine kinase dimerization/phosphoacceptor domain-containing protein [Micromonosporaceae bacterium]